jgi:hypothetical protein
MTEHTPDTQPVIAFFSPLTADRIFKIFIDYNIRSISLEMVTFIVRATEVAHGTTRIKTTPQPVIAPAQTKQIGRVTESIFSSASYVIPLAEVQHIEPRGGGCMVVFKSSTYNSDFDDYNNGLYLDEKLAVIFKSAWCRYRSELEHETLMDLSPPTPQPVIAPEWVMLTDDDFDQIAQTAFQAHTTGRYGSWEGVQPWVTAAFKTIQVSFIAKQGGAK